MPRYSAQNLAALDPDYRKANNISLGGGGNKKRSRYAYGKQNNIFIASGQELTSNGLCFRLLPIYETPGNFANFREGPDGSASGDWCRLVHCAHWVGNPGLCFIVHDGNPEINLYESPLHVLRKAAWDNKETPGIGRLFTELLSNQFTRNSHIGSLKKPEETLFISASSVYINDAGQITLGAFTDDRDRNARIIGLKKSAAQAMLSAIRVQNEAGEYMVGDMLSFGPAQVVTFIPNSYTSGGQNLVGHSVAGPATFQCPKYVRSNNKSAQFVVGYPHSKMDLSHFAIVHDTYMGQEISLEPYAERIVAETQTWDDYLWVPTYEEQAEMLAPVFPKEALDFAWREHPEYLRHIPRNTTTVSMMSDDDSDVHVAAPSAPRAAAPVAPATSYQPMPTPSAVAPWEGPAELSAEDAAGVVDMFAAATDAVPPGAATVPPPPPSALSGAPAAGSKPSSADILAKARARAAAGNR